MEEKEYKTADQVLNSKSNSAKASITFVTILAILFIVIGLALIAPANANERNYQENCDIPAMHDIAQSYLKQYYTFVAFIWISLFIWFLLLVVAICTSKKKAKK